MKLQLKFSNVICLSLISSIALGGCGTSKVQYATTPNQTTATNPETIRSRQCDLEPPVNSTAVGNMSYWTKECINNKAQGSGTGTWWSDSKPTAILTGDVKDGKIHSEKGAVFTDKRGKFTGSILNGQFIVGKLLMPNGDTFEGSFYNNVKSQTEGPPSTQNRLNRIKTGVLKKKNGVVIAGIFDGEYPIGEFYYADSQGKWYATYQNGRLQKRKAALERNMTTGESIGLAATVLTAGALGVVLVASTGALLMGSAAVAALSTPRAALMIIRVI